MTESITSSARLTVSVLTLYGLPGRIPQPNNTNGSLCEGDQFKPAHGQRGPRRKAYQGRRRGLKMWKKRIQMKSSLKVKKASPETWSPQALALTKSTAATQAVRDGRVSRQSKWACSTPRERSRLTLHDGRRGPGGRVHQENEEDARKDADVPVPDRAETILVRGVRSEDGPVFDREILQVERRRRIVEVLILREKVLGEEVETRAGVAGGDDDSVGVVASVRHPYFAHCDNPTQRSGRTRLPKA